MPFDFAPITDSYAFEYAHDLASRGAPRDQVSANLKMIADKKERDRILTALFDS